MSTSSAAIASTTATAATTTTSAVDRKQLAGNLNQFLTLLVTQLQHQDPLDPMDTNAFTQQLVEFAGVEQQIQQNANLEKLIAAQSAAQVGAMSSYLGRTVETAGPLLPLQDGVASGTYTLSDAAAEATLTIRDATGKIVHQEAVDPASGRHSFAWNGLDQDGTHLADGTYLVEVAATRRDGAPIETKTTVFGRISSASFADGDTTLLLGDTPVATDAILALRETAAAGPAAN